MDKSRLEIMIHSMRRMWFYSTADSRSNKRDKEDTSINNMPHTLSLPDQVKLADLLELEDVNIIQIEGGKCSNPTKYGVLGLIEKRMVGHCWAMIGSPNKFLGFCVLRHPCCCSFAVRLMKMQLELVLNWYLHLLMNHLIMMLFYFLLDFASYHWILKQILQS
ncbi:uncharacterized protein LOC110268190 isoform X1 [Arachis ipaensis]|uniref:uncharacterized protein LOC110268190 isoform X1 n=1 Tax=Arachis ipaensis TaxID=130454 RepID=UPI000A2B0C17|nr:uncharacterized protein LOC110268190 isoform X1 [Arachis ipaensis]XP_020969733.1 uncharacterized protein LOC110268190 isoform X1 [Arachis ipaensis]